MIIEDEGIRVEVTRTNSSEYPVCLTLAVLPLNLWSRLVDAWSILRGRATVHRLFLSREESSRLLSEIVK
jgi:hypothetical protein